MEAAMCQLVGYGTVNSFIAQLKRRFGKQVTELFAAGHVTGGIQVVAMLQDKKIKGRGIKFVAYMDNKIVVKLFHAGGVLAEQSAADNIETVGRSAEVTVIFTHLPVNSYRNVYFVELFFYFAGIEVISVYRNQHFNFT